MQPYSVNLRLNKPIIYCIMKPVIFTLSLAAICIASQIALSQIPIKTTKPVKSGRVTLRPIEKLYPARPQAPSRQRVSCQYDGENLVLDFVYSEGTCTADLTEMFSGYTQTYTFDSDDLTAEIHVGQLYESTITLTTEAGNTYTADLTAE